MSHSKSSIFQLGKDTTKYRLLTREHVKQEIWRGKEMLVVEPQALTVLAKEAFKDVSHLLRPTHLANLRSILDDKEASPNDHFVALELLRNAAIAAGGTLPMCQDTGTAIVVAHKGEQVLTDADDAGALAEGIKKTYGDCNLRYSQMAPLNMYQEANTGSNLPAQIEIYSDPGDTYEFLFIAKGGGSANKTYLMQETKSVLNPQSLRQLLTEKIAGLGTSACPPYHLAIVIGGLSAEMTLKTVKLASCHYLDSLPTEGDKSGRAFRDLELEKEVLEITRELGIGAQFGGKYFCHDVRVIRLPRHGASLPIGIGVSCSADRQIMGRIDKDGIWLEQLEQDPARFLPEVTEEHLGNETIKVDLTRPMEEIRAALSGKPVGTRLMLTGTLLVARDIAHARWKEVIEKGEELPEYTKQHPIYYAGPAKTPTGYASGSFGPTTAGRMDSYADLLMSRGASLITLAKGNRGKNVREACERWGGFYLGTIGGAAARLAQDSIKKVETIDYAELGMEAVFRIEIEDFPAFIVINDKGEDFFAKVAETRAAITK
ncbi:MAG TPA: fumarate hydratase [Candidatus Obscuribacter sp.]|nr:fumarate hydratase [Candidatus Obscuribacter sp.]HNB13900.1 fumarate hydratase [Candidatus Obscuribacter sp.]HND04252.1 fumarate hydratase [Candidatus Obscuribacter sp.]HND65240.1 fumarate hydratase [Candidatus Obscuribacter sp.]HNG19788.1 fumarate hydratase [Candidatus Obscuribacter sp.]